MGSIDMRRRRVSIAGALLFSAAVLFAGCTREPGARETPASADSGRAAFVGSERCASCHAQEAREWERSQHRRAMQPARGANVLGDFNDARFTNAGITTTFAHRDGCDFVTTDGPDGKLAEFAIEYTFGIFPLQQYLVELPRGHVQALPFAWDARAASAGGQRWFHLYPGERLRAGDPLHWTGFEQNWNFMCADCHATNLRKNYDVEADRYATTWSELGVGCESCHGPGSKHVTWAEAPARHPALAASRGLEVELHERRGVTWSRNATTGAPVRSTPRESDREIEVCGRCHSRRSQLTGDVTAADSLHDGFRVALLEPGLYWPDGQMRDEVFNYGSFLQSRMYAQGVTCGDCHEPHSEQLRVTGDGACLQCHDAKLATPAHHFHQPESAGARCVACHMPVSTYMQIDRRHDHSFRIPRPDLTTSLGVPNACTSCHVDRTAGWASQTIRQHYPHPQPGLQTFGPAFAALEHHESGAAARVAAIAVDSAQPAIVRASALARLAGNATSLDPTALRAALGDPSPLIRRAAVPLAIDSPAVAPQELLPLLRDPTRSVRLEAAAALASLPPGSLDASAGKALDAALEEYLASERFNADRPESLVNLGTILGSRGDLAGAQKAFERARDRDPGFLPAYVNLADVYRANGDEQQAEAVLRAALLHAGTSGSAHHALALSLVRQGRLAEALPLLAEAAAREPRNARFAFVYAVALQEAGQVEAAIATLRAALEIHPDDGDLAAALEGAIRSRKAAGRSRSQSGRPADPT